VGMTELAAAIDALPLGTPEIDTTSEETLLGAVTYTDLHWTLLKNKTHNYKLYTLHSNTEMVGGVAEQMIAEEATVVK